MSDREAGDRETRAEAALMPPPSPEPTTSSIRGASTSGWSPLRVSNRVAHHYPGALSPASTATSSSPTSASAASPQTLFMAGSTAPPPPPSLLRAHEIEQQRGAAIRGLKSHSLVSNSPFKQQQQQQATTSPNRTRVGLGLGIGGSSSNSTSSSNNTVGRIPRANSGFTPRKLSDKQRHKSLPVLDTSAAAAAAAGSSSSSSGGSSSDDSAGTSTSTGAAYLPPRKSQGFKALASASYVSNSPFKASVSTAAAAAADTDADEPPPVPMPRNAWAMTASLASPTKLDKHPQPHVHQARSGAAAIAAAANARPSTPENGAPQQQQQTTPTSTPRRRTYHAQAHTSPTKDALLVTPTRSSGAATTITSPSSPTTTASSPGRSSTRGRGLLVSNRLHGPREACSSVFSSPGGGIGSSDRERRKTVTFDELLDVQEFEKESSLGSDVGSCASSSPSSLTSFDERAFEGSELDVQQQQMAMVARHGESASADSLVSASDVESDADVQAYPHRRASGVSTASSSVQSQSHAQAQPQARVQQIHGASGRLHIVNGSPELESSSSDDTSCSEESGDSSSRDFSAPSTNASDNETVGDENEHDAGTDTPVTMPSSCSDTDIVLVLGAAGVHNKNPKGGAEARGNVDFIVPLESSFEFLEQMRLPSSAAATRAEMDLHGLHRVDSMVDELLNEDLLFDLSPGKKQAKNARAENQQQQQHGYRPLPTPPPAAATGPGMTPTRKHSASNTPTPTGRPRISRNTVLERVASQKQQQQQQQQQQSPDPDAHMHTGVNDEMSTAPMAIRSSATEGSMSPRPAVASPQARKTSDPVVAVVSGANTPSRGTPVRARVADIFTPAGDVEEEEAAATGQMHREPSAADMYSDAASAFSHSQQKQQQSLRRNSDAVVHTSPVPPPESVRRDSLPTETQRVSPLERVGELLTTSRAATSAVGAGDLSGRVSPSLLGPPPPRVTPAQQADQIIARRRSKNGKPPMRRRSRSTGDAHAFHRDSASLSPSPSPSRVPAEGSGAQNYGEEAERHMGQVIESAQHRVEHTFKAALDVGFGNGIEREISRIYKEGDKKYRVNDRGVFQGVDDKISHHGQAGDVDSGRAWRKLRRPSDMHEYAKEIREFRDHENPKKAAGKVFVMVDSFIPDNLPVPSRPTKFYCILDNGLHMVKTGSATLRPNGEPSRIAQEFELIQHKNLEFSLTLVVQRDAHLQDPSVQGSPQSPKKDKFMSRFFSSPRKGSRRDAYDDMAPPGRPEPLLAFMNREGALGYASIIFEKVASQCLGKCAVFDLPVIGVSDPAPSLSSAHSSHTARRTDFTRNIVRPRGMLRLKMFYLPPMPSVPRNAFPENLSECIRGIHAAQTRSDDVKLEGVLTQMGGDCTTWRRRPIKLQGTALICYNEITKKPTVKIDLSKAVSLEDMQDPHTPAVTPGSSQRSGASATQAHARNHSADEEEYGALYNVERSFRITFHDGEKISFFADTDEEKGRWLEAVDGTIKSHTPAAPMWAHIALALIKNHANGAAARGKSASAPQTPAKNGTCAVSATPSRRVPSGSRSQPGSQRRVPPTMMEEESNANIPDREMKTAPKLPAMSYSSTRSSGIPRPHVHGILVNPHPPANATPSSASHVPRPVSTMPPPTLTGIPQRSRHVHHASIC